MISLDLYRLRIGLLPRRRSIGIARRRHGFPSPERLPSGARNDGAAAMTEVTQAMLAKELGFWLPRSKDGLGRGSGVAATSTESALRTPQIPTTWFPVCHLRRMWRPCGSPPGMRPGGSMADDAERRDLAEKAGYGSATTPPGDPISPTDTPTTSWAGRSCRAATAPASPTTAPVTACLSASKTLRPSDPDTHADLRSGARCNSW
jgi:hypothetical protein